MIDNMNTTEKGRTHSKKSASKKNTAKLCTKAAGAHAVVYVCRVFFCAVVVARITARLAKPALENNVRTLNAAQARVG